MSIEVTRIAFTTPFDLRNAINKMRMDAERLGHSKETIEFAPGVAMLVEDTLSDGSKVARIVIAQVQS